MIETLSLCEKKLFLKLNVIIVSWNSTLLWILFYIFLKLVHLFFDIIN